MDQIENSIANDHWLDEIEYHYPGRARLKRERQAYEEAEREGFGSGKCNGSHYTGERENILQL